MSATFNRRFTSWLNRAAVLIAVGVGASAVVAQTSQRPLDGAERPIWRAVEEGL